MTEPAVEKFKLMRSLLWKLLAALVFKLGFYSGTSVQLLAENCSSAQSEHSSYLLKEWRQTPHIQPNAAAMSMIRVYARWMLSSLWIKMRALFFGMPLELIVTFPILNSSALFLIGFKRLWILFNLAQLLYYLTTISFWVENETAAISWIYQRMTKNLASWSAQ